MLEDRLSEHLLGKVGHAVGPAVKVRLVNLHYVSREDHLGPFCEPGVKVRRVDGLVESNPGNDEPLAIMKFVKQLCPGKNPDTM